MKILSSLSRRVIGLRGVFMLKKNMSYMALTASVLLLSGCATPYSFHNYIPDGYTYQDSTPISSPAPSSPWFDQAVYSPVTQAENDAAWRYIATEMLERFKKHVPASNTPVYLKLKKLSSPENQAFDHYFRQALLGADYILATSAENAQVVYYDVQHIKKWDREKQVKALGESNVLVPNTEAAKLTPNYTVELYRLAPKQTQLFKKDYVWIEKVVVPLLHENNINGALPPLRTAPVQLQGNAVDNPHFHLENNQ